MERGTAIMCVQWKSNHKLGCSYYSSESLELLLMEDIRESGQFEYTLMLIAQIQPKLIIMSDSASDDALYEFLQSEYGNSIEIQREKQKEFTFEKGRSMLLNWYIIHIQLQVEKKQGDHQTEEMDSLANHHIYLRDPDEGNKTHAYLQLEGLIHLDESEITVGCAGVLLKHLQSVDQEQDLNEQSTGYHDLSIQPAMLKAFSCESCMHVNSDTIKSLSIFDLESHSSIHQKQEHPSLFGLLDKTSSVLGKQLLREWVSRPSTDKNLLDARHASIHFLSQPIIQHKVLELASQLKHIKNIHRLLSKVRETKATSNDWQYILKFAFYTICIFSMLNRWYHQNDQSRHLSFIKRAKKAMPVIEIMKELGSSIDGIIDFESSKREGRIIVKEGIDKDLDLLRERYDKLEDYLLQVSQEISATLPVGLGAALNVVYFPQLGYLITLPQYHLQRTSSDAVGGGGSSVISSHCSVSTHTDYYHQRMAGFELQFTTADNLYYKNDKTKELDETIGDIHAMIADKEIEIIQELASRIIKHTLHFAEVANVLSELDCLISLTLVALRFNYVQPIMTNDSSLTIIQGRHPLQELCVDVFIPNDISLKGGKGFHNQHQKQLSSLYQAQSTRKGGTSDQKQEPTNSVIEDDTINSVVVVTGANFSGKSVYLKQTALIVYMAHIGSFVPAENATIGITDKLFTRIQTSETVSKPQSAFGFDLQQLNRALYNATRDSLVIIDEFGKGTDCSDGAALFCSVLGYFLSRRNDCPKIVASTHFHDLISKNILSAEDSITLSQTEIMSHEVDDTTKEGESTLKGEEVVFLYRIVPGQGFSASHGIWCAGIAGIPTHIIERAVHLSEKYSNGQPMDKIETIQEQECYAQLERIQQRFIHTDINEMDPIEIITSIKRLLA